MLLNFLILGKRLTYKILVLGYLLFTMNKATAAWVQLTAFGGEARHRCTGFSIGNKGYIGGGHTNSGTVETFKDYWEFDPSTNCWTQIADFGGGYRYHSTAFTIGNFGYVGLGENEISEYKNDFWKYIPLINTWVQVASFPGDERRGACSFVIDDKGYVGTGQTESGYSNEFFVYDPVNNIWTQISNFTGEARSSAVAFAYDGKGYVGTGHILGNDTNDFYEYNPTLDLWTQKSSVGGPSRQDATGFVLNGEGYIGTGNDNEGNFDFDDFWKYDFSNDLWIQVADFDGLGRRYMVSFTIGNVAYCGTGTNGTNLRDFWAFYPLLGEKNLLDEKLIVFPNPATEYLIVKSDMQIEHGTMLILDCQGKIVRNEKINSDVKIFVGDINAGIYSIVILQNNEILHSQKISIQR